MQVNVRHDDAARERAHAATRGRRPPKPKGRSDPYLAHPGALDPLTCRCRHPVPIAEVDRLTTTVTVSCLTCGKPRATLDRLDLAALAVAHRAQR